MDNMINSMFNDPFGMMGGMMGPQRVNQGMQRARPNQVAQMSPFGGMFGGGLMGGGMFDGGLGGGLMPGLGGGMFGFPNMNRIFDNMVSCGCSLLCINDVTIFLASDLVYVYLTCTPFLIFLF